MNTELEKLYYNLELLRTLKVKIDQDTVDNAHYINKVLEDIFSKHSHQASLTTIEDISTKLLKEFK